LISAATLADRLKPDAPAAVADTHCLSVPHVPGRSEQKPLLHQVFPDNALGVSLSVMSGG